MPITGHLFHIPAEWRRAAARTRHPLDWQRILTPHRLCALADENQSVLGLGVIVGYEQETKQIRLRSPTTAHVRILQLGDLSLSPPLKSERG